MRKSNSMINDVLMLRKICGVEKLEAKGNSSLSVPWWVDAELYYCVLDQYYTYGKCTSKCTNTSVTLVKTTINIFIPIGGVTKSPFTNH